MSGFFSLDLPAGVPPMAIIGALLAVLVLALAAGGWWYWRQVQQRERRARLEQERQRRRQLLDGTSRLRLATEPWERGRGVGQVAIAAIGTAAANQLPFLLECFARAGAEEYVGPVLVAEPAEASRAAGLDASAARLPAFHERVVPAPLPLLPGGFAGRTAPEVMRLRPYWIADFQQAIGRWLALLRRDARPVYLLALVSPGGSGAIGREAVVHFKTEYDQADCYVALVLDPKTDRRLYNLPPLLDLYARDNLVRGFIIGENRRSPEHFDLALAVLPPSMIAATWIDPKPQDAFNVLADVFRRHQVATVRIWQGRLPVYYLPAWAGMRDDLLGERFYTQASFLDAQAIRGIRDVLTRPVLQSLPLPTAEQPVFLYVVAPVRPTPDFQRTAERVRDSIAGELDFDTTVAFASLGWPLAPTDQEVPIIVAGLFPIEGGIAAVKEFVQSQQPVLPEFTEGVEAAPRAPRADVRRR